MFNPGVPIYTLKIRELTDFDAIVCLSLVRRH